MFTRSGGILLHPVSLPTREGIGTLGDAAFQFVDWLAAAGMNLWQVLPLGPTGYGDSPYAAFSVFAGNPLLVDLLLLQDSGLLTETDYQQFCKKTAGKKIDYAVIITEKIPLLKKAARTLLAAPYDFPQVIKRFEAFCKKEAYWLDTYALFMSIKEHYDKKAQRHNLFGQLWNNYWPARLARKSPSAIKKWSAAHAAEMQMHKVIQFFFFEQWSALKIYANKKGIQIIGDMPIFTALDSADVWAHNSLFQLDPKGVPLVVSGVPPDYFSKTGQLWGNPLYDWDAMQKDGFTWWRRRVLKMLEMYDYIRIDHFRGFESAWAVPYPAKTAEHGIWQPCPGYELFTAIRQDILAAYPDKTDLPIIAEDLGIITKEVEMLRDDFSLPGMKVLQFAFDANEYKEGALHNPFLPHTYDARTVVYTGTHDNTTLRGWVESLEAETLALAYNYVYGKTIPGTLLTPYETGDPEFFAFTKAFCKELLRLAYSSTAMFAIIPMQDILFCAADDRMNTPSQLGENWSWRMPVDFFSYQPGKNSRRPENHAMTHALVDNPARWLFEISRLYGRHNKEASCRQ